MAIRLIRPGAYRGFVSAAMLALLPLPALSAMFLASERGQSVALHVRIMRGAIQEANRAHEEHRRQIDAEFDKAMAEADALLEARLRELRADGDPFGQAVPKAGQEKAGPTTRPKAAPRGPDQNRPELERRERQRETPPHKR